MKIKLFFIIFALFLYLPVFAENFDEFNGKTISAINIATTRIRPEIVRKKFLMQEGEVFFADNYDFARQNLHDMRIFKSIDFNIVTNDNGALTINIDAKDGFYVFPMFFGTGGSKSTFAGALIEANLFKAGETALLFGAGNSDGYMAMAGFGINSNFFSVILGELKYDETVYDNYSYSSSGLFSSKDELDDFKKLNEYEVQADTVRIGWSKSFLEKIGLSLGFDFADVSYSGANPPKDEGSHNKISLDLNCHKNFKPGGGGMGGGMGALFGVGLSDIADKIADLHKVKFGYFLGMNYENGADYTGSDYTISKIKFDAKGNVEFKKRHILFLDVSAAKAFETPFYDRIRSVEVLSGRGIYSREFRGEEAIGAGTSFVCFLFKNKVGVMTLTPFAESAVVWDEGNPRNQTGVGIGFSYRPWRIPFPLGLNYTQNITDGTYDVSFIFGGGF